MSRFSPITAGTPVRRVEVDGFALTEATQPARLTLQPHAHENASISLVLRGEFTETLGHGPEECGPLSLVFKPDGAVHSNQYGREGARCLFVEVHPLRLDRLRSCSAAFETALHIPEGPLAPLAVRLYDAFRRDGRAAPLLIEGLLLELIAEAGRGREMSQRRPAWLAEAEAVARERLSGGAVRLSAVAAEVGVNAAHFARTFRQHHGVSFGAWTRRLRIEAAAHALTATRLPLVEVAADAGFCDQSHFTNVFRRHTGLTPAAFRAAAARGGLS